MKHNTERHRRNQTQQTPPTANDNYNYSTGKETLQYKNITKHQQNKKHNLQLENIQKKRNQQGKAPVVVVAAVAGVAGAAGAGYVAGGYSEENIKHNFNIKRNIKQ